MTRLASPPEPNEAAPKATPRRSRRMLGLYVTACSLLGLALLCSWLWVRWHHWWFDAAEARRRQQEAASQLGVPIVKSVDLGDGIAIELVLVPAGMFDMGSPEGEARRGNDEGPVHRVRVSRPFYVGTHEITQKVWERVMGSNPSYVKRPELPVEQVSWNDCQKFLRKLNVLTAHKGSFRLPTEAEWEWACRAGTRTMFYSCDADADFAKFAKHHAESSGATRPAGRSPANAWGLYDCHGNAWEWCSDWYGEYSANSWPGVFRCRTDPQGARSGKVRVMRGGFAGNDPYGCRSADRDHYGPSLKDYRIGFRVALELAKRQIGKR